MSHYMSVVTCGTYEDMLQRVSSVWVAVTKVKASKRVTENNAAENYLEAN
jgi:hypothetical protein